MLFLVALLGFGSSTFAQIQIGDDLSEIDYARPQKYEIGGIVVEGAKYVDASMLSLIANLRVGETISIPGDEISSGIKKIWEQGLFEDVAINATDFVGNKVFLQIAIKEKPRVSKFSFKGIKKSEADDIRNKINLSRGDIATDHLLTKTTRIIEDFYYDKGYLNVDIDIEQKADTARENYVDMVINIDKGKKVKIGKINVNGNENFTDGLVLSSMKETKERGHFDPLDPIGPLIVNTVADLVTLHPMRAINGIEEYFYDNYRPRIFKASKYLEKNFEDDKKLIIAKYNAKGYRDARIVRDSVYRMDDGNLGIDLFVDEGNKYHYRSIKWTGNTKYSAETLNSILGIKPGDVYNKELLDKNLTYSETNLDISSLYMDDGYLFFRADPVEVAIENDSIDLEIRLTEGKQARISNISLAGNTKTYDHVVLRELYTRPGQLFSRSDVVRSVRELATLGFFNQESINPDVQPNPSDNTVDIKYSVEEAAADQIRFSAGYAAKMLMLEAGLQFSNFSLRNIFNKKAWRPIPVGDGQKLGLSVSTLGTQYITYSISFTEPWLGGRKPNAFSASFYQSFYAKPKTSEDYGYFNMTGGTIGLGRRLTWPDDYFSIYHGLNVKRYNLNNYQTSFLNVGDGKYNLISYSFVLSRNSVSQPIYPRNGSEFQFGLEITPPYSLLTNMNYTDLPDNEKYKWIEMHRWTFKAAWFTELYDKLVLMTRVRFGYLGHFNSQIGPTPFHRFFLGGDGLSNYSVDSRELVGMRGYANNSLTPGFYNSSNSGGNGGDMLTKYTLELRYPLSLNPQATIYALTFLEAGNCWLGFKDFNPFDVKRSAGVGVRIYLPMFGLLGLDWGYGFDEVYGLSGSNGSQFHFSIGGSID